VTYPGPIEAMRAELPGVPADVLVAAPSTPEDVSTLLRFASETGKVVDVRGGGSHHGFGSPTDPEIVVSMEKFDGVEAWDPDDLTLVVGAGMPVERLEAMLAERSQSAVLPEIPGSATVGGVISAGLSSLRRGRLLGTRERMLEVTLVTGDGRIVRAGGRVVKNVTGYDLPRFVVGAFGSLGVITSVCLKLWPVPPAAATVVVDEFPSVKVVSRPLAILEEPHQKTVFLSGTESEVDALATRLAGAYTPGLHWPADPLGSLRWSLRVPPANVTDAISRLPQSWGYLAVHGVGELRLGSASRDGASDLRDWAESIGGRLVVVEAPAAALPDFDPWGAPPPGLALQRRLIAQFDPRRIINPGRLPGGL
jgi:glycolate oxidase FAD binding subunit